MGDSKRWIMAIDCSRYVWSNQYCKKEEFPKRLEKAPREVGILGDARPVLNSRLQPACPAHPGREPFDMAVIGLLGQQPSASPALGDPEPSQRKSETSQKQRR